MVQRKSTPIQTYQRAFSLMWVVGVEQQKMIE